MIIVKSREEIELMRESALIVSKTLGMIASEIKEGVTIHLDKLRRIH
jgi:methionyl aminopeptidase